MGDFSVLIAVVAFVLVLIALSKHAKLETKIAQLKLQTGLLADEVAKLRSNGIVSEATTETKVLPEPATAVPAIEAIAEAAAETIRAAEVLPEPPAPPVPPPKPPRDMEQALASRWFVWIGGVAIAIGGLLFVKYAYDNGLISPVLQIFLGLLAGAVLVAAGEWVRRRASAAMDAATNHVPAALSAAGLAILFASVYAAYALYGLVAPLTAFVGLAAIGIGSLALSRWQGPFIATLGLVGSYATPALIPSEHPSAWGFFPYLLIILAACLATLRGRTWWWLGFAAIAGSAFWGLLWITTGPFQPGDVWPLGLFAHVLGIASFFGVRGLAILGDDSGNLAAPQSITAPLVIGLVGLAAEAVLLAALLDHMSHAGPALGFYAAAVAVLVAIAWAKPGVSALAPVAGLLMLVGLMAWNDAAFHAMTLDEQGNQSWSNAFGPDTQRFLRWMLASGAALTLAGIGGVLLRPNPRNWGLLGGAAAFLFVVGAWGRVDFLLSDSTWAVIATVFAAALLAGVMAANSRVEDESANLASGLLAAGSAGLLVLAFDRMFDRVWLTIAIAVLATAYAVLSNVLKPRLLGPISVALATLATMRLFVSRELWNDDRSIAWGQHWVLYGYGLPALLFFGSSRLLRRSGHEKSAVALEGITLGLIISLVALELRVLIAGGIIYEEPQFLEMAAHILTWLGAAYGLMYRQRIFSSFVALWGSRLLIAGAVLGIITLSLVALNPVVTEAAVPGNIAINALLLAYLAPVILLGLIARRLDVIGWEKLRPAAGALALLLAFVYVTIETKRVFQGKLMVAQSLTIAESYAYSAVWLAFALALFVAGIKLGKQYVRYAGLGVMVLVVLKVFLWDMSSLEGLYRIASFIGLGLCLVGIGWLYQRFVQPRGQGAA